MLDFFLFFFFQLEVRFKYHVKMQTVQFFCKFIENPSSYTQDMRV